MTRTVGFVFVASLLLVSAVSADLALPKDVKYIDPRVSFEGISEHADYVFHLRYLTFNGGPGRTPHSLLEVKDSNPFNLNAQRRLFDMKLLAIKRTDFEKRAKEDPTLKWLTDKTEGVLPANVFPPSTTAPVSAKEAPVTTYRVTLKDGKLTAERMLDKKRSDAAPTGPLPTVAIALACSLSLGFFGVWIARRGRPNPGRGA